MSINRSFLSSPSLICKRDQEALPLAAAIPPPLFSTHRLLIDSNPVNVLLFPPLFLLWQIYLHICQTFRTFATPPVRSNPSPSCRPSASGPFDLMSNAQECADLWQSVEPSGRQRCPGASTLLYLVSPQSQPATTVPAGGPRLPLSGLPRSLLLHIPLSAQASVSACVSLQPSVYKHVFFNFTDLIPANLSLPRSQSPITSAGVFTFWILHLPGLKSKPSVRATADKPGDRFLFSLSKHCREAPRCLAHQGSSQPEKQETSLRLKTADMIFVQGSAAPSR